MRVKPVPAAPDTLAAVADARGAIPLVPGGEEDCCTRLQRQLSLPSRDEARRWLTLLRGMGHVEEGPRGYHRTRNVDDDPAALRTAFLGGVYGARELLERLERTGGLDRAGARERFDAHVPTWERLRAGDGSDWSERTDRLLDWLVLLGLAERRDGQYVAATERD